MTFYSQSAPSKYSFSNASMVFNEDGIQIHREELIKVVKSDKKEDSKEGKNQHATK
jgi:hypothetical protein